MKYKSYLIGMIGILLFTFTNVNALSCSNKTTRELGLTASYVNVKYEVIDNSSIKELVIDNNKTTYRIPNFEFEISVYNITDDIYLEIKNENTRKTTTVRYSDTSDGVYTFKDDDFGVINKYTIKILSNVPGCASQKIRTIDFIKPKYNAYSEYTYCNNSSSFYCQRFVTKETGLTGNTDFLNKIKVNNENNRPESTMEKVGKELLALIKENWVLYLVILVVVIGASIVLIIYLGKRKKKSGWNL